MAKYSSGIFKPKNPQKYVGKGAIQYRSSWERVLMQVCDQHPNILQWASESIQIPYLDPNTLKWRMYIPDFFIIYIDRDGKKHGDIIEIKPMSQTLEAAAKSKSDRAALIINTAKWRSAVTWCNQQGLVFRIMTENEIFRNLSK